MLTHFKINKKKKKKKIFYMTTTYQVPIYLKFF